jgi:GNAT superfamily N-acetyltransferase
MNIIIRKAVIEDLSSLLAINYSSFEANAQYDPYIDMNWIHSRNAQWHFRKAITKEGHYAIVAEVDGKSVGFLFLSPKRYTYRKVKMIELDIVAVLPKYRSQGVGEKLLDEAKQWAKGEGYQTIYVSSYYNNKRAVSFYTREGFSPIDIAFELTL